MHARLLWVPAHHRPCGGIPHFAVGSAAPGAPSTRAFYGGDFCVYSLRRQRYGQDRTLRCGSRFSHVILSASSIVTTERRGRRSLQWGAAELYGARKTPYRRRANASAPRSTEKITVHTVGACIARPPVVGSCAPPSMRRYTALRCRERRPRRSVDAGILRGGFLRILTAAAAVRSRPYPTMWVKVFARYPFCVKHRYNGAPRRAFYGGFSRISLRRRNGQKSSRGVSQHIQIHRPAFTHTHHTAPRRRPPRPRRSC